MTQPFVHPSAIVDPGATLGDGVKVWHFSHVSEGAQLGAATSLGQNVFVGRGVRVGARVKIQNNVSLYEGVELDDDVFLGPSCVFTNVINPRAFVERKHEYRRTHVGQGASIGANATIVCGHDIGAYAFVAAGATVTHAVPAHALVMGTPARRTAWVCRCGQQLPATSLPSCAACALRYRIDAAHCVLDATPTSAEPSTRADVIEVPLLDLAAQNGPLEPALRAAFQRVLASNHYILGPEVERFEAALCQQLGFAHAITVSSGTDALLLALMALELQPGDEVITSPFSFFATAGCIARVGARPVFVDIDPVSFNLDASLVAAAITPRTRAVLPVHLFGQAAALTSLAALCEREGLALIEDAAQALGATERGRPVGSVGSFGCFSFFPSKNLGGFGDGGLVVTSDARLAERARVLRAHGGKPKYHHQLLGGNFRLDALQAALLSVKLPHLPHYAEARRAHAQFYDQRFAALAPLVTPRALGPGHVYNQYVVRTTARDPLRAALTEARIGSEIYYPRCLHEQPCFAALGYRSGDFVEAERAAREVLALPVFPELRPEQREHVARTVEAFFSGSRA
jgi:dTDP-4-amino-4,6-dideoxygalactose transaminase/acetyltransferase-like isoleucine patch superfamily enzyme